MMRAVVVVAVAACGAPGRPAELPANTPVAAAEVPGGPCPSVGLVTYGWTAALVYACAPMPFQVWSGDLPALCNGGCRRPCAMTLDGEAYSMTYDARNRWVSTRPIGAGDGRHPRLAFACTYDGDRLASCTDPRTAADTSFVQTFRDLPDGSVVTTGNSGSANVVLKRDANGDVVSATDDTTSARFTYDPPHRLVAEHIDAHRPEGYSADIDGNPSPARDQHVEVAYRRDRAGRLVERTDNGKPVVTYTYDASHRLTRVTDSSADTPAVITISYDTSDNPVRIDNDGSIATYEYTCR